VTQAAAPPQVRVVLQLRPADASADLQPLEAPHLSCPGDTTVDHLLQVLWRHLPSTACQQTPLCGAAFDSIIYAGA
jgi:hypothetical protein